MVVPVDGEVKSHEFAELRVLIAEHADKVCRPVLVGVNGAHAGAVTVQVAVDYSSNRRQLGNEIHAVLIHCLQCKAAHGRCYKQGPMLRVIW